MLADIAAQYRPKKAHALLTCFPRFMIMTLVKATTRRGGRAMLRAVGPEKLTTIVCIYT